MRAVRLLTLNTHPHKNNVGEKKMKQLTNQNKWIKNLIKKEFPQQPKMLKRNQ